MSRQALGLDIGRTCARACHVRIDRGGPRIVRYDEIPLPLGTISNGEVVDTVQLAEALDPLRRRLRGAARNTVLGVGSRNVIVREHTVRKVAPKLLQQTLRFQTEDILPVSVADTVLDYYPNGETRQRGVPMYRGLLVAAMREPLTALVEVSRNAGFHVTQVDLDAFALTRAYAKQLNGQPALIVHIGSDSTNIVAVRDGVPQFVRIISNGGTDLTRAVQNSAGITEEDAEAFKKITPIRENADQGDPREDGLNAAGNSLAAAIVNTIRYYANSQDSARLDAIYLTGGAAQQPGLAQIIGNGADLPLYGPGVLDAELAYDGPTELVPATACLAYGLALKGVGR